MPEETLQLLFACSASYRLASRIRIGQHWSDRRPIAKGPACSCTAAGCTSSGTCGRCSPSATKCGWEPGLRGLLPDLGDRGERSALVYERKFDVPTSAHPVRSPASWVPARGAPVRPYHRNDPDFYLHVLLRAGGGALSGLLRSRSFSAARFRWLLRTDWEVLRETRLLHPMLSISNGVADNPAGGLLAAFPRKRGNSRSGVWESQLLNLEHGVERERPFTRPSRSRTSSGEV
jgi:hypothetical protein